jgi:hypothetical protein
MVEQREKWSIRKCADQCVVSEEKFKDRQWVISILEYTEEGYVRRDFCEEHAPENGKVLSSWRSRYLAPPPPDREPIEKESAESLIRNMLETEQRDQEPAIYILALMLERKKLFIERDVTYGSNGETVRVYEHRKTNESFIIKDPGIKLSELADVQEQVIALLER